MVKTVLPLGQLHIALLILFLYDLDADNVNLFIFLPGLLQWLDTTVTNGRISGLTLLNTILDALLVLANDLCYARIDVVGSLVVLRNHFAQGFLVVLLLLVRHAHLHFFFSLFQVKLSPTIGTCSTTGVFGASLTGSFFSYFSCLGLFKALMTLGRIISAVTLFLK